MEPDTENKDWPEVEMHRTLTGRIVMVGDQRLQERPERETYLPLQVIRERLTSLDSVATFALVWEKHWGGRAPDPSMRRRILTELVDSAFPEQEERE